MDYLRKEKLKIIKFLNDLSNGIYPEWLKYDDGMCYNLSYYISKECHLGLDDFYRPYSWVESIDPAKWGKFSGSYTYPIPDLYHLLSAHDIYYMSWNKWEDEPYSDLRREYCKWYADQLLIKFNEEYK